MPKKEIKILVVGDSCLDAFIYGRSDRLCPDMPVPVFSPIRRVTNSGMAGNVFSNLESMGAECFLVSNLEKNTKERYVDLKTNHTFLRVDKNDKAEPIDAYKLAQVIQGMSDYDAVVISDYGKGFLSKEDIAAICKHHDNVFIDTKKTIGDFCKEARCIKINTPEFEAIKNKIDLKDWTNKLIVTQGDRGCMLCTEAGFDYFPVNRVDVHDLSGAGDTFLAGLVIKFIETKDLRSSIEYANVCASNVVQERGVFVYEDKDKENS
jgi:D-beta-D-heptose 7-phosphate kinase/D-beta-D-heptose 1-phosphate adenosyltransferase